eukprot:149849-Rhodomonas_salina.1
MIDWPDRPCRPTPGSAPPCLRSRRLHSARSTAPPARVGCACTAPAVGTVGTAAAAAAPTPAADGTAAHHAALASPTNSANPGRGLPSRGAQRCARDYPPHALASRQRLAPPPHRSAARHPAAAFRDSRAPRLAVASASSQAPSPPARHRALSAACAAAAAGTPPHLA